MFGGQGKDSNLRCDFSRIATLASRCLKPLSHLSVRRKQLDNSYRLDQANNIVRSHMSGGRNSGFAP